MSYVLTASQQAMDYHPKNKAPVPGTPAPRPRISFPGPGSILQPSVELTAPMSSQVEDHLEQTHWFLKGLRKAEHRNAIITRTGGGGLLTSGCSHIHADGAR